jgi:glyoxylase I family protein
MKIEHVAINVPDPKKTAAWYVENLGLKVVRSVNEGNFMHFLADESGQSMLEIYRNTSVAMPDYPAMASANLHIAFLTDDMDGVRQSLLDAGATAEGEVNDTPAGDRLAFLRDPWGVPLQLVQRKVPMI